MSLPPSVKNHKINCWCFLYNGPVTRRNRAWNVFISGIDTGCIVSTSGKIGKIETKESGIIWKSSFDRS